jgi:hypothetical protein
LTAGPSYAELISVYLFPKAKRRFLWDHKAFVRFEKQRLPGAANRGTEIGTESEPAGA